MRVINVLMVLLIAAACSTGKPQKIDNEHTALHSGDILQGKYFHVEIVGTHKDVKIYPYELDQATNTLKPLDTKAVKIEVVYSPYRSESDYTSYMVRKKEHFWGEINDEHEKGYQIYIKLKFEKQTDRFVYTVRPKA